MFPHVTPLPFIARHAIHSREETRRLIGLDATSRVALLSFGGYGLQRLNLSQLDCLTEWTLLLTDRIAPPPAAAASHVKFLPESTFETGLRYEDLVAAVDVVVTKPGYGIVSECVAHQTPMLYTSRGRFVEYGVMVAEMPRFLRCAFIDMESLLAGRWREALDRVRRLPPPPERPKTNGAEVVAAMVRDRIASSQAIR